MRIGWPLVDVVQPVDDVEKREGEGKYYPWPSVDGIDVGQVWDFNLELRGASTQAAPPHVRVPVNAEAAGIPRRAGLPALEPWRVEHHGGGVVAVAQRGGYLVACRLIVDLQGGKQDVALGVHLDAADSRSQNQKPRWR